MVDIAEEKALSDAGVRTPLARVWDSETTGIRAVAVFELLRN